MRDSAPSTDTVEKLLSTPKALTKPFGWIEKHGKRVPPRYEYRSAVNLNTGLVMEGVGVIAEWRQSPIPGVEPTFQVGLFYDVKHRVYAIDVNPHSPHRNKKGVGVGFPYHDQKVTGSHEHIWTGQYGYAEPINLGGAMEGYWNYFCSKTNIDISGDFMSPEFDSTSGQGRLW